MKYIYISNICNHPNCKSAECEKCQYEKIKIHIFGIKIEIPKFILRLF